MAQTVEADASPEKRLFISLLTRDISLIAAFLDLIDNSLNSAIQSSDRSLDSAADFSALANEPGPVNRTKICIRWDDDGVEITDTAAGIPFAVARDEVFRFGTAPESGDSTDRLSVYGIGLKRALFKTGNHVSMQSLSANDGFTLELNVAQWAASKQEKWSLPILPIKRTSEATGTMIRITELHEEVSERLNDGTFEVQLRRQVERTYSLFLDTLIDIEIQGRRAVPETLEVSENHNSDQFEVHGVSVAISVGLGPATNGTYRTETSGWFVFCNGRAVIVADTTLLTGWGSGSKGLPRFQPKHRPFIGMVFLHASNPELLPWNTTKSGINEDSMVWQATKSKMLKAARSIISFLDSRYSSSLTEKDADVEEARGGGSESAVSSATQPKRKFSIPKKKKDSVQIQFPAKIADIDRIRSYVADEGLSAADVGRLTFHHYLDNEVD